MEGPSVFYLGRYCDTEADDMDRFIAAWAQFYNLIAAKMLVYGQ